MPDRFSASVDRVGRRTTFAWNTGQDLRCKSIEFVDRVLEQLPPETWLGSMNHAGTASFTSLPSRAACEVDDLIEALRRAALPVATRGPHLSERPGTSLAVVPWRLVGSTDASVGGDGRGAVV